MENSGRQNELQKRMEEKALRKFRSNNAYFTPYWSRIANTEINSIDLAIERARGKGKIKEIHNWDIL